MFFEQLILIPDPSSITLRSLIGDKISEANDNLVFDDNTHVRTAKDGGRGMTDLLDQPMSIVLPTLSEEESKEKINVLLHSFTPEAVSSSSTSNTTVDLIQDNKGMHSFLKSKHANEDVGHFKYRCTIRTVGKY